MGYLRELIDKHQGESLNLQSDYINPQFAKVLHAIGFDIEFTRGEGPYLFDKDGNRYLDFIGGYSVFSAGRSHPVIKEILHEALDLDLPNLVKMNASLLSGLLAKELVAISPDGLDKVFFANSGAEAVETSIKYARATTGRDKVVYIKGAFHGLTLGALSVNGDANFRDGFGEFLPGAVQVPYNDLTALTNAINQGDVAAFIFECIQGKGVKPLDKTFLAEAQRLCKQHGTLMIADEVQTGLGRTGKMFAFEHYDITPDMILISKSLSGGYVPVSATITTRAIYDKVFSSMENCVRHSSTFSGNSFSMAAGLAALKVVRDENLITRAQEMGNLLRAGLEEIAEKSQFIKEVRGQGLMLGVEFHAPRSAKLKLGWSMLHGVNKSLFSQAIIMSLLSKHRILSQVSGHAQEVIRLIPPLVLGREDVDQFLSAFGELMGEAERFPGVVWDAGKTLAKLAIKNVVPAQTNHASLR